MSRVSSYSDGGFRFETLANGWRVGRFGVLEAVGIPHMVTTRQGPEVQTLRNDPAQVSRHIARELHLEDIAFLRQVHGGEVLVCDRGGQIGQADGLITTRPGLAVLGKSGDCPIVLIADRGARAVGFAHASWRATVAGITSTVVRRMGVLGCDPVDLCACICPSAGPECYEVGLEVRQAALQGIGPYAAEFFSPGPRGKDHFDLWAANGEALRRSGLRPEAIHVAAVCTICRNDLFPSHRREADAAGRFACVVGLAGPPGPAQ